MRSYDILVCGSLKRKSVTVNDPFGHFARRGSCQERRARAIQSSQFLSCLALLIAFCCILAGCNSASLTATSAQTGLLSASTSFVAFGSVVVGQTASATVAITNTGPVSVEVTQVSVAGQSFALGGASAFPITLPSQSTYNVTVSFSPLATGTASGQLTIGSNSGKETLIIGLTGTGTTAPPPVALSSLSCASPSLTGAGTDSCTVTLNEAAATGGFAVSLSSSNSLVTVPATVTVATGANSGSFSATVGSFSSTQTVTLTANAGDVALSFALQLSANSPALGADATSIAFGNVDLNTPATQSITLSSTGGVPVTVSAATVVGAGFTLSGATLPLTLSSNQTVTLNVQFDPTTAGPATGTLTIVSTSLANPITTISLSGTGITAGNYEVNLSWNAPVSSPDVVAGYNVYRSPDGASQYQQLNSTVLTQTSYSDQTVQSGQSYDYIVESVDASGLASAPSNAVSATIP